MSISKPVRAWRSTVLSLPLQQVFPGYYNMNNLCLGKFTSSIKIRQYAGVAKILPTYFTLCWLPTRRFGISIS